MHKPLFICSVRIKIWVVEAGERTNDERTNARELKLRSETCWAGWLGWLGWLSWLGWLARRLADWLAAIKLVIKLVRTRGFSGFFYFGEVS